MANETGQSTPLASYMEGLLLLAAFVVVSLTFAGFVALVSTFNSAISLPMLVVAGLVLLLICLAGIAYVFVRTGLQDPTQALGLPPGSMQAVIALSLVVLFAILSIFLFTSMSVQSIRSLPGLSVVDRDNQIGRLGASFAGFKADFDSKGVAAGTYTIFVRDPSEPGLEARNDIAKQLLILIGTLMTSAVGFYFGSRATAAGASAAVAANQQTADQARPVIDKVEPAAALPRGQPTPVKVTGTGLSGASIIIRQGGGPPLHVTSVVATDTEFTCTVTPDAGAAVGDYDVVMTLLGRETIKRAALKVI
jgi:hypothetical protein